MAYGAITVGTSAALLPGTGSTRTVYNNGAVPIYRGDDSSVTTSTGTSREHSARARAPSRYAAAPGSGGTVLTILSSFTPPSDWLSSPALPLLDYNRIEIA